MKQFKFKDGSIITASTVDEAKQKHKVVAAKKNPQMKIIVDKLKELGLTIRKNSNGHLYARSKSYFKDSYYDEKNGLWVEITDFEDGSYEYDMEICRYDVVGVNCIVSFGGQTKSLDKMFAAIKSKCEEFEIICNHRNKVYELEQKFTRKA
jgi:hypothetical protein